MTRLPQLGRAARAVATHNPPAGHPRPAKPARRAALAGSLLAACLWPAASNAAVGDVLNFFYDHQQNIGAALPPPPNQNWWLKGTATETVAGVNFLFTTASSGNTGQFFNDFVFNVATPPASVAITCTGNTLADCQSTPGNSGDGDYIQDGSAPLGNFISTTGWELTLLNAPPQGGEGNQLNEAATNLPGETIFFSVTGLTVAQLTTNADNGYFSCTHHQGLANAPGSSRLCAKLGNDPAPGDEVPGPLPILGAAAAFGYSRKLRRKLKANPEIH